MNTRSRISPDAVWMEALRFLATASDEHVEQFLAALPSRAVLARLSDRAIRKEWRYAVRVPEATEAKRRTTIGLLRFRLARSAEQRTAIAGKAAIGRKAANARRRPPAHVPSERST